MHRYTLSEWLTIAIQGAWVRAKTPRLPEALGVRDGEGGDRNLADLRLLILGDSAAAGVGVDYQQHALTGQLVGELQRHYYVHWRLIASSGTTSKVACNEFLPDLAEHQFDVAVLSLGVNDVTRFTSDQEWKTYQQKIWQQLIERHKVKRLLVTPVPPMEKFTALPDRLASIFGKRAAALNSALFELAKTFSDNVVLLDFEVPTDKNMLAKDGFHPSNKTYRLWANAAARHCFEEQ